MPPTRYNPRAPSGRLHSSSHQPMPSSQSISMATHFNQLPQRDSFLSSTSSSSSVHFASDTTSTGTPLSSSQPVYNLRQTFPCESSPSARGSSQALLSHRRNSGSLLASHSHPGDPNSVIEIGTHPHPVRMRHWSNNQHSVHPSRHSFSDNNSSRVILRISPLQSSPLVGTYRSSAQSPRCTLTRSTSGSADGSYTRVTISHPPAHLSMTSERSNYVFPETEVVSRRSSTTSRIRQNDFNQRARRHHVNGEERQAMKRTQIILF